MGFHFLEMQQLGACFLKTEDPLSTSTPILRASQHTEETKPRSRQGSLSFVEGTPLAVCARSQLDCYVSVVPIIIRPFRQQHRDSFDIGQVYRSQSSKRTLSTISRACPDKILILTVSAIDDCYCDNGPWPCFRYLYLHHTSRRKTSGRGRLLGWD